MKRFRFAADQAFELVKKTSQDRNVKLRVVARGITETGEIPPRG
jgi:AmiR/NasT family two-component response regulator